MHSFRETGSDLLVCLEAERPWIVSSEPKIKRGGPPERAGGTIGASFNLFFRACKEFSLLGRAYGIRLPIKDRNMTFQTFMPKIRSREVKGTLILGLGGAAAWAAIHIYRARSRQIDSIPERISGPLPKRTDVAKTVSGLNVSQAEAAVVEAPAVEAAVVEAPSPETLTADWVAGNDPDVPSVADDTVPEKDLWTEAIRQAMDRKPFTMGYDKSVWTVPLLCRYLEEAHGLKVPMPRVRAALKEMGYHWKYSRYVRAANGNGQNRIR
jgi:hypothetical protein